MSDSMLAEDTQDHVEFTPQSTERTPLCTPQNGTYTMTSVLLEEDADVPSFGTEPPLVLKRHLHTQASIDEIYTDQSETRTAHDVIKSTFQISPSCLVARELAAVASYHFLHDVLRVLKNYQWRNWLVADVLSGLSVAFLHIPQGLGAGYLSSLGPINGLYTSFFPILVYLLFGTSPHVSMGTNALIALMTASLVTREADHFRSSLGVNETWTAEEELQYKVGISAASCFVGGVILLAMGIIRLGFITNFMAKSFIGGFTFSAAVHVASRMLAEILHVKTQTHSGFGKLVRTYVDLFKNIADTNLADVIVGVITAVVLVAMKMTVSPRVEQKLKIPLPVDLIVVIVSTIISHFAKLHEKFGIGIVGDVPTGLPAPTLPDMDSLSRVAVDAFITALLIFALTMSLAKLTAKLHNIAIDDNQEMVAYGLCLLVGGFFQNFPCCVGPPRSMLLSSLGSKSTLNGVSSAVLVLLVLVVAGQLFVALPVSVLGAMVIVAMKDLLFQLGQLPSLWHVNKADFFIWVVTTAFSVLGDLDLGLLVGVVFSMATVMLMGQFAKGTLLGKAASEDLVLTMDRRGVCSVPGVKIFRFDSVLYFATQERFRSQMYDLVLSSSTSSSAMSKDPPTAETPTPNPTTMFSPIPDNPTDTNDQPTFTASEKRGKDKDHVTHHVILDCSAMTYIDVAGVDVLTLVMTQLSLSGINLWLADVPEGSLGTLQRAGFVDQLGKDKIFFSVMDAVKTLQQI